MEKNHKLVIAGTATLIAEPLLALLHTGGIGAIVGLAIGGAAYVLADDFSPSPSHEEEGEGHASPSISMPNVDTTRLRSLGYRMLNGKSVRSETHTARGNDDDFGDSPREGASGFRFSDLLSTGWRPSYEEIFLARLEDGTDIFITVEQAVHIALAGSTRQGKTSIIRQLLAQLCYVGCTCILMDPHYTPYDVEIDEDWTPYTPYLRYDPLECKSYGRMEQILRHTATTILDRRKQRREATKPVGTPIFILIDEYPAVVAEQPEVQKYVAKLLREGAKYKIFLCVASQDFQVKTVSPQAGGAIRDCYKTCFYVGGDKTTANVLLDMPVEPRIEAMLGKGPTMLRCAALKQAKLAQTPFLDNQALYTLLGPSTYQPVAEEGEEREAEDEEEMEEREEKETEHLTTPANITPIIPEKGPKADDIDINVLCACWNGGANSVTKLERLFKMSHGEAYKAYKRIKAQRQEPVEEQE